ncbi:MAG: AAA family ATPase [Gemmatimonadota bacterium]
MSVGTAPSATVARVLERLQEVRPNGAGWKARCPCHDDENPSLNVNTGDDGRTLLHCFVGCAIEDVVAAVGLTMRDLFPPRTTDYADKPADLDTLARLGGKGLTLARYAEHLKLPDDYLRRAGLEDSTWVGKPAVSIPYRDQDGTVTATRYRLALAGDRFRWAKGSKPTLYGLPGLDAARSAGFVLVVEGESDVHVLRHAGIPAVGIPGAQSWRDEWAPHFGGIERMYLFQEPDQGGAALVRKIAGSPLAPRVQVARFVAGGKIKDPAEFWAAWPETKTLTSAIDAALAEARPIAEILAEEEPAAEPEPMTDDEPGRLPHAIPMTEIVRGEPPAFFVETLIPDRELAVLFGRGGSGKSTLALHLAGASAAAEEALEAFGCAGGPVLYVTAEDPADHLRNRLEALCSGHGWDRDLTLANVYVIEAGGHVLEDAAFQAHVLAEARRIGARLAVFDPFKFLTRANENSNTENAPVVAFLGRLAREVGLAVVVLHHETKPHEDRRRLADRLRGATALYDGARAVLHVDLTSDGLLTVTPVKMNRAALPARFAVAHEIETAPENPAAWVRARFYRSGLDPALPTTKTAILNALDEHGQLTSNDLKAKAADRRMGIDPRDVLPARHELQAEGVITFTKGPNNSKIWHRTSGHGQLEIPDGHGPTCPPEV